MLRSLQLKGVYKSDEDDILRDFYFPALSVATHYDRAVGYFSASTLSHAGQAVSALIRNGGSIRLILGAFCDADDIAAVKEGIRRREIEALVASQFADAVKDLTDELLKHRFEALAWLVASNRLDLKIALRPKGVYHDKIGIISDAQKDAVVFAGSANESAAALLPTLNYESIDVFPCWREELADYHAPHRAAFERLWSNTSRGTAVLDFPTALRERFLEAASNLRGDPPSPEKELELSARIQSLIDQRETAIRPVGPHLPDKLKGTPFKILDHQRDALNAWKAAGDFQGVFDLATGAGKTITAIYAIVQMSKVIQGLTVVIAAPYQSLADQWCEILETFNIRALKCYVSKANWLSELNQKMLDIETRSTPFEAIVVVNRTLSSPEFQAAMSRIPGNQLLWIGDECHHHGAPALAAALPQNARYRIGLSATPDHYLDDDRNARLRGYYGATVYRYTLAQAIADKVLTPYNYFPRIVELTTDETESFVDLSDQIARQLVRDPAAMHAPSAALTALLMQRARILSSAVNKVAALESLLAQTSPAIHTLFYCGDGRVSLEDDEAEEDGEGANEPSIISGRQVEVVSQVLDRRGWRVSRFTARESRREREDILDLFRSGIIHGLVAIKCLDEGIDVPACSTAYILASSRDPRQFIQRRGRILRRSPGKTLATIHDFVVVLAPDARDPSGAARKLIRAELERVAEFSSLAQNRSVAYDALRPVLQAYNLEHAI